MSSKEPGQAMRLILRALPDSVSVAIQRKLWPDRLLLDGMSDASRRQAVSDLFASLGGDESEINCPNYGPPFDPPWIAFPDFPGLASMGFRMGGGQDYMVQFQGWYASAAKSEIDDYKAQHPAPEHYADFYETLDDWHRSAA